MIIAKKIMDHSKIGSCIRSIPINGKLVSNKGNTTQCMAHNKLVAIPTLSQFNLSFMRCKGNIKNAIVLQKCSVKARNAPIVIVTSRQV